MKPEYCHDCKTPWKIVDCTPNLIISGSEPPRCWDCYDKHRFNKVTFKSDPCRALGELPLFSPAMGMRYGFISVSLTLEEWLNPKIHEWINTSLLTRVVNPGMLSIHIEKDRANV